MKLADHIADQYEKFAQKMKLSKCRRCKGAGHFVRYADKEKCPECFGTGKAN